MALQVEDAPMTTPVRSMKPTELCGCSHDHDLGAQAVWQEPAGHPRPILNQRAFERQNVVTRLDIDKFQDVMKSPVSSI